MPQLNNAQYIWYLSILVSIKVHLTSSIQEELEPSLRLENLFTAHLLSEKTLMFIHQHEKLKDKSSLVQLLEKLSAELDMIEVDNQKLSFFIYEIRNFLIEENYLSE